MKVRPLILNDQSLANLHQLRDYAAAHPINLHEVFERIGRPDRAVGNDPHFRCVVPVGYRCVFNIEQQKEGMFRHASFSVDDKNPKLLPSPEAVNLLMRELGFTCEVFKAAMIDYEHMGWTTALNVWEKIKTR